MVFLFVVVRKGQPDGFIQLDQHANAGIEFIHGDRPGILDGGESVLDDAPLEEREIFVAFGVGVYVGGINASPFVGFGSFP